MNDQSKIKVLKETIALLGPQKYLFSVSGRRLQKELCRALTESKGRKNLKQLFKKDLSDSSYLSL